MSASATTAITSTSSSIVALTAASTNAATATATTSTSATPHTQTLNEALFLSSLTSTPSKPSQPFTFRRSFLTKHSNDGGSSEEKDKESAEGVLRFGRHHPRRAELVGEWEEELIAQLQKQEEEDSSREVNKASGRKKKTEEGQIKADKEERSPPTSDDSPCSSPATASAASAALPATSSSSSSSQPTYSPAPTTPLSAADASLSSVLHLLAADKQPTLPERICNLLTAAIAFHASLMQQFASHVLQPGQQSQQQQSDSGNSTPPPASTTPPSSSASLPLTADKSVAALKHDESLSTLPHFAAKYATELTSSLDALKEAETLLVEWKRDMSLVPADLAACDSLLTHVLTPLSATFTSLLSPNPSLSAVASPSSLVASFLLAKRGRGRLHKCDKHRRWKKKCPPDCPDKPQGKWEDSGTMDEDDEEEDEDEDEDDDKAKKEQQQQQQQQTKQHEYHSTAASDKKRRLDGHDRDEQQLVRAQPAAKRAHEVAKVVHAFQPIATATAIAAAASAATSLPSPHTLLPPSASPPPTKEEVIRAREAALAASVIPSAVPLASVSPMPHGAQMIAHPVARPASLPSTQTATLYAAQPLMLQSAMPARPGMQSSTLYTFAPANQLTSSSFAQPPTHTTHTLVTLEQLTAMQQQGNTFRILQSTPQPQPGHAHTHQAAAFAQPYIPPQMSVVYTNAGGGGGGQAAAQGQSFAFSSMPAMGSYQMQQQ